MDMPMPSRLAPGLPRPVGSDGRNVCRDYAVKLEFGGRYLNSEQLVAWMRSRAAKFRMIYRSTPACRCVISRMARSIVSATLVYVFLGTVPARGQINIWTAGSGVGNWNDDANWSLNALPGNGTTAVFGSAPITSIDFGTGGSTSFMLFNAGAPQYSFNLNGATFAFFDGIVNNSSAAPIFTVGGPTPESGQLQFDFSSTAANALIFNNSGGLTLFTDTSTASTANIINGIGGVLQFRGSSTAGNAMITNQGGGLTQFHDVATAGNATITTDSGGMTEFEDTSTGGSAQLVTNAGGTVDISNLVANFANMTAGSIAGAGTYALGSETLKVGSNNLSTIVSGTIEDGGIAGGTGGALVKVGTGTLTLTGTNTYTGGTTITAGTVQLGGGGTTGSILGDVIDNAALVFDRSGSATFGGLISGTGTLTQNGTGKLTLTATNTYAGGTNLNAGTVSVNSDSNLGTGTLTFNGGTLEALAAGGGITSSKQMDLNAGGGTFLADAGTSSTLSGVISGAGALTMTGSGTLSLTGVNTYSGGTNFNAGTISVDSDSNLGTGTLTINGGTLEALTVGGGITSSKIVTLNPGGGTFLADAGTISTFNQTFSGPGALTMSGTGKLVLEGLNNYSGGTNLNGGTLAVIADNNLGTGALTFNGGTLEAIVGAPGVHLNSSKAVTLNSGGGTFLADANTLSTLGGVISGAGAWTMSGPGTLRLSGTNSYSGGTNFNGGTLQVNSNSNLGTGPLRFAGGTLEALSGITSSAAVTLNAGGGTFLANGGTSTLNGAVTGPGALTKSGGGTLILNANESYTGGTTITAGTLDIGNGTGSASILGNVTDNATLGFGSASTEDYPGVISGTGSVVQSVGTLILTGTNTYTGGTTISGGTLQIGNGGATGSIVGNVTNNSSLDFDLGTTATFAGVISGSGGVTQGGGSTLILTGANTYTGGTSILAGILQIGNGGTTGSIVGPVFNEANLVFDRSDNITFSGGISGLGFVFQNGTGTLTLTATNGYSGGTVFDAGTIAVNSDRNLGTGDLIFGGGTLEALVGGGGITSSKTITLGAGGGTFLADPGTTSTLSGSISDTGSFTKAGSGVLILAGDSTYTGSTTVAAGTLEAGSISGFSPSSAFTVNSPGVLDLHGFNSTIASLAGSGTVTNNGATPATLTAGGNNGSTTFAGIMTDGTSSLAFVKLGSGTMALTGANTYSGQTTISRGTLLVDGSLGAGAVLVSSGATLGGSGTIGGAVTVQRGNSCSWGCSRDADDGDTDTEFGVDLEL